MRTGIKAALVLLALVVGIRCRGLAYTDSAMVSLLTCSPGSELYSKFGHSAIRVYDPYAGLDIVYNYGLFDFNTPNFYLKFIRGKLPYQLGVQRFYSFMWDYQSEGRKVEETPLLLDLDSRKKLLDFLEYNYRPENRQYPYDFFFDNCASRIRDVLEQSAGITYTRVMAGEKEKTFRQLLDDYIKQHDWIDFGIDLILGLPADQKADFRAEMFLPDYLSSNLRAGRTGNNPVAGEPILLLESLPEAKNMSLIPPPFVFFSILFLGAALLTWRGSRKAQKRFDMLYFSLLGLSGALFTFMWVFTDHDATYANLNLLWANPLAFMVAIAAAWGGRAFWLKVVAGLTLAAFFGFPFLPQQLHPAVIPLMLITLLRCGVYLGEGSGLLNSRALPA
jgi:hypothetical protein